MLNCWHLRLVTEQVSVYAQLGLTMQAMYPERMYRCFIINAPSFFTMLWRVMDPLMTERVKKKISIFRTVRPDPTTQALPYLNPNPGWPRPHSLHGAVRAADQSTSSTLYLRYISGNAASW